ncbi:MAG: bifunctional DNA-formamidopyrimidine glycosylase/DNA-(apurinic or apyrimidinic site) lyase [Planctomycetales bacterium]|nr:bifunctional DNA-formamidopyrimidine glycosylase/DNA-(apurinic or apyrimidinic site) lyase [Planctomycetales bacterium]
MPELPEVETMCRGIAAIVGRRIARVREPKCDFRPISIEPSIRTINNHVAGETIERITRLGKRVCIHTHDWALILQPKMTGLVSLTDPPDDEHIRLEIEFEGAPDLRLLFWDRRGLGTVQAMPSSQIDARLIEGKLGPDALQIECEEFCQRIRKTRRPIKVALLDQKLIAGVGNLYASEILHRAAVSPLKLANKISLQRLDLIFECLREVLQTAIEHEGSTLSDGTYRNALNAPGDYQNEHLVYDREGEICQSCRVGRIARIVQAQRSTFYCPKCQR